MASSTANLAFNNEYAGYKHATTTGLRPNSLRKAALSLTTAAVVISLANVHADTTAIFVPKTFLGSDSHSSWRQIKTEKELFLEKFPSVKKNLPMIYSLIGEVFVRATVNTSLYKDEEENWENLLISVNSGMVNFDEMRNAKKKLFSSFASQGIDVETLKHITFSIE